MLSHLVIIVIKLDTRDPLLRDRSDAVRRRPTCNTIQRGLITCSARAGFPECESCTRASCELRVPLAPPDGGRTGM